MVDIPKKIEVLNKGGYNINFKGTFHFENLYKLIFDWLGQRGYSYSRNTVREFGDENFEDYYFELVLPGGAAKCQWIFWRAAKPESDIFKYNIEIDFQTLVLGTKEIVVHGDKFKTNDGELTIMMRAWIDFDKNGIWSKNDLVKKAFPIVREHDLQELIDDKIDDLHGMTNQLWELIKQYLGLIPLSPMRKPYHPQLGVPQTPIIPK